MSAGEAATYAGAVYKAVKTGVPVWSEEAGIPAMGGSLLETGAKLVCPAPIFIAEGQFCVCKDETVCPKTGYTMSAGEAATYAGAVYKAVKTGVPVWSEEAGIPAMGGSLLETGAKLVCPAPIFIAEGQFCVCADETVCPKT